MVEPQYPSIAISASLFCSGVPICHRSKAKLGPLENIQTAGLAPSTSSATAHCRLRGASMPPSSAGSSKRHHSASLKYARKDFLKLSGIVTEFVSGSKTGG